MNGLNQTTEGAPIVGVETKTKATRKNSALPTVARRKVLAGKHKTTGAPKLEVIGLTKNLRRGAFTLMDIFNANGQTISLLTIKKRKNELFEEGKLGKMARDFKQHEGSGRPPEYFNFDLAKSEAKKVKTRKVKVKAEAPAVAVDAPAVDLNARIQYVAELELPPAPEQPPVEPIEQPAEPAAV